MTTGLTFLIFALFPLIISDRHEGSAVLSLLESLGRVFLNVVYFSYSVW